ncbi:uncharacterized protein KY384_007599 [Bacidia gigantensis]|uniref:uncharacterized protein n=1 Tax=Bacidia gigantensis TaxID=2732470 RepID=UPI001D040F34|nr:uncharacterized protein KY384_007599 [Bacidia gigantensis]KAG8527447.1 hypothetical protein KY384_007599 [Bacidia gigantensis]
MSSYELLHHGHASTDSLVVSDGHSLDTNNAASESSSYLDGPRTPHEEYQLADLSTTGNAVKSGNRKRDGRSYNADDDFSDDADTLCEEKPRRGRPPTIQSSMPYTVDEEREVVRRLDRRLVLFVAFLYMLSFLDRSNIGNAKVAGMYNDLHLSSEQFEWLLRAFYITYVLFEWMTLLWKVFAAHKYLAIVVGSWGIIASLQALTFSFWSILILRACLGIGEAGFVGIPFYLSMFFKREELALRTGLFISAAPLATAIAGTLAWMLTKIGDQVPIASWRLLFLLEGFPSAVVAVFVWINIPDEPGNAKFLNPRQRKVAKLRLRRDDDPKATERKGLTWKDIGHTLIDPKAYLMAAMMFCCNVAFSSLPVFLPTIINEMGYSRLSSQALSAPPYFVAFFTVLVTAWLSDSYRVRSNFVIFHALLAASGYTLMAVAGTNEAGPLIRYIGVYPAAMGFFSAVTIIITWALNNQKHDTGKATGLSIIQYIGQLGPLVGVHLYPQSDRPYFVKGMATCAGFMGMVAILAVAMRLILMSKNRKQGIAQERNEDEGDALVGSQRAGERFVFII